MNRTLADLDNVVALGGGHGLGRLMSSIAFLGSRLTGIVTTTDNGGSTGRIRQSVGGIAWGDMRNCINQLITHPSIAASMFEYRFSGQGELNGHNLGNLMLTALENLSVRPLEAINLIRNVLKVDAMLIPMSEHPLNLLADNDQGARIYGEMAIDAMDTLPRNLRLDQKVPATQEAIEQIEKADLILIGPGSFYTSLLPILLLDDISQALRRSPAKMIFIDNLGKELSPAGKLNLKQRLMIIEQLTRPKRVDAVIVDAHKPFSDLREWLLVPHPLAAKDIPYRHDRQLLHDAIEITLQQLKP